MDWKFVLVLIFSLFVAIFTMQNSEAVNIQFLGFEFNQISQALVILISAASGAVIVLLFGAIRWVKDKSTIMGSKKSIAGLETQVKQLRIMLDAEIAKNTPPAAEVAETTPALGVESPDEAKEPVAEPAMEPEKPEEPAPKKNGTNYRHMDNRVK
jgi:uncharacterized integral membrane protein